MAIAFIKERKKQKYFMLIAVAMLGVALVVLYLGYFKKEKPIPPSVSATAYREIKINFEVLENPFLKGLQLFEKVPVFGGQKGRENPFLPY